MQSHSLDIPKEVAFPFSFGRVYAGMVRFHACIHADCDHLLRGPPNVCYLRRRVHYQNHNKGNRSFLYFFHSHQEVIPSKTFSQLFESRSMAAELWRGARPHSARARPLTGSRRVRLPHGSGQWAGEWAGGAAAPRWVTGSPPGCGTQTVSVATSHPEPADKAKHT